MSSDVERAWRPHIYRAWIPRIGVFRWTCTVPRANAWTGGTLHAARQLERQANQFVRTLNQQGMILRNVTGIVRSLDPYHGECGKIVAQRGSCIDRDASAPAMPTQRG